MMDVIKGLYEVALERKGTKQEGSYTCYLFEQGLDKILKNAVRSAVKSSLQPKTEKMRTRPTKSVIFFII